MADTQKIEKPGAKSLPAKAEMKNRNIFDKYKAFLEEHLSREDHNTQKVATRWLTVHTKGTFDYVALSWEIHTDELEQDYPDLKKRWSLYGIRRFGDFTKLDAFPDIVDGEVFIKTAQPKGIHKEYLKAGTSANFALFLVAKYSWSSRKKILGPLTISLTPLRASTTHMWEEISKLLELNLTSKPEDKPKLENKLALLDRFHTEAATIQAREDLSEDEKSSMIERRWDVYESFVKDSAG